MFLALGLAAASAVPASIATTSHANAATAEDLNRNADQALQTLYRSNPVAQEIGRHARAILVFPNIVKAGLVFGGAYGAQSYGYVVFLMTNKAVNYIHQSQGWEIGVGPTVVIVDQGVAKNLSTSTLKDDAYAFIFNQQGLMGGISLEGTKISRIKR
jgi:lipid-binding SYLF domain-containing protein